jgi:hypothetical protein
MLGPAREFRVYLESLLAMLTGFGDRLGNAQILLEALLVSLPQGRIQEIKRIVLVNLTHGIFLTYTENLIIFTDHTLQYLQDIQHLHPI